MLAKQSIITPQIIKEREDRHRRLMRMIKNYKRTSQQTRTLEKIKNNTTLQINLRYLRSEHNRHFRFPKMDHDESSDEDINRDQNPFTLRQNVFYDLKTQNQIKAKESQSVNYSLERNQRVKSLQRDKSGASDHRLGRIRELKQQELSLMKNRKKSMIEPKRVLSTIKLPELKREKINTESKNNQSIDVDRIVSRKLLTEANTPVKGQVPRYLRKQQNKSKKKFIEFKQFK